ncbi:hypothetical protein B0H65DRAFT_434262, partial [Neurospora tetraspora]
MEPLSVDQEPLSVDDQEPPSVDQESLSVDDKVPLSVDQFLGLNQHDLALFVKDNLTDQDGALRISNISDWTDKTVAPSVDPLQLATLLARVLSSRSSTVPPLEDEEYQARCYQALLDDGCRPLFPLSLLPQVSTDPDAYRDMLRPWAEYPDTPNPHNWVFFRQLRRWKEYRAWQLVNRRQTVGFSEYLDDKRRELEMMGEYKVIAKPNFEQ